MFQQAIKRIRKPGWLAELRKYLRIYRELVRMQLQLQSVYRFNFLCGWTAELGWVIAKLLYSFVIFSIVPEERGLYFLLIGTYILLTGICMGLWGSNISLLSDHIKSGALDLHLCQPVSAQFLTTFYKIDFGSLLSNAFCGGIMVLYGWKELSLPFSAVNLLFFLFAAGIGLMICYPLFFLPQLLAFRYVSTGSFLGVIWEIWDLNNLPFHFYPRLIQAIGLFLIPVLLPCALPALLLLRKLPWLLQIWCFFLAVLSIKIFQILYKRGLRKYSSAGG